MLARSDQSLGVTRSTYDSKSSSVIENTKIINSLRHLYSAALKMQCSGRHRCQLRHLEAFVTAMENAWLFEVSEIQGYEVDLVFLHLSN